MNFYLTGLMGLHSLIGPMAKKMLWLDLEMTGLDDQADSILEVAAVVTDWQLKYLEQYTQVVFQPPATVTAMNEWCQEHHGKSGLTAAIPSGKPLMEVEKDLLALSDRHFQGPDKIVIVGNSIGNDRRFIARFWPTFEKRLHYRMVDVSSFKEVFRERYKIEFKKTNAHRALGDIDESIKELAHYLGFVVPPGQGSHG
ncbi:MAG: oligoribonuclease [Bdellovibrionota bacterium]